MHDPNNWYCGPISDTCAAITGGTATTANVCQLRLRAVDLIPTPDEVDLVWYPGGLGTASPTAAEALYLAVQKLGDAAAAQRRQLCSASPGGYRAFVKVAE